MTQIREKRRGRFTKAFFPGLTSKESRDTDEREDKRKIYKGAPPRCIIHTSTRKRCDESLFI